MEVGGSNPSLPTMTALELRLEWMKGMGFSEEEIQHSLLENPPSSIEDEQVQLDAQKRLQEITPSSEVLSSWSKLY